ncbi:MAG: ABC transporter permease [Chloroflexi bacterium]|nr:ABC transporter permease [Chloroflexota bacterium]
MSPREGNKGTRRQGDEAPRDAARPLGYLATRLPAFWSRLKSWEGLLLVILIVVVVANSLQAPAYLSVKNQVNLFGLFIEKIIIALMMAFVIINGEIDLSVASVMGLTAVTLARLFELGVPMEAAVALGLLMGVLAGAFNAFWIAVVGLPSLVVTLAGLIMYRGLALVLVQDRSITGFPAWFNALGQQPVLGPLPLALVIFIVLAVAAVVILHFSGFGRYVFVIGSNAKVARYSGVKVRRVKALLFIASGTIAALAGMLYAARLGAVRGSTADGFELDIITMVLMGGVSISGGTGSLYGVLLSILIILNLRNGMSLANLTGHIQTGVIGTLLILSVLVPNLVNAARERLNRRRMGRAQEMVG